MPSPPKDQRTPLSDDEIRASWIREPPRVSGPITLSDYDPVWPELFAREADRLHETLGARSLRVEHIGSTAVPGLAAKPIIDMLLVVADSSDEGSYVPPLEDAGYILTIREPDWFEHRVFKGPDTNVNLHVVSNGCTEIDRWIGFRDRLRTNDDERAHYERTKRALAVQHWTYVQNYADAKTAVIGEILARAGFEEPS